MQSEGLIGYSTFLWWVQIDHSVIESFGALGRTCITARVYPTIAIGNKVHLYVFNLGTETVKISNLKAWSMGKAKIN